MADGCRPPAISLPEITLPAACARPTDHVAGRILDEDAGRLHEQPVPCLQGGLTIRRQADDVALDDVGRRPAAVNLDTDRTVAGDGIRRAGSGAADLIS